MANKKSAVTNKVKDIITPTVLVSKDEWKAICTKEKAWCEFDEVKNMTYEEAVWYVQHMPTFVPM